MILSASLLRSFTSLRISMTVSLTLLMAFLAFSVASFSWLISLASLAASLAKVWASVAV